MNNRLHLIRSALEMSQTEFGRHLGVSGAAISRLENGDRSITEQSIKAVCREFNVNENWLRTGEGKMFNDLDLENQLMIWMGRVASSENDDFKKKLLYILMNLTENQWDTFEDFAKKLVLGDITDKNKKV